MRDYLSVEEVEAITVQTLFVAPLCFGPTGVWIEGINPKQVDRAMRFVNKMRKKKEQEVE